MIRDILEMKCSSEWASFLGTEGEEKKAAGGNAGRENALLRALRGSREEVSCQIKNLVYERNGT